MTLGTHAVAGAALAGLVPTHPVAAFVIGFASHFILDAIPHWDYELRSTHGDTEDWLDTDMEVSLTNRKFLIDIAKISFDALLGIAVGLVVFASHFDSAWTTVLAGAIGGIVPDALQFVYWKIRREPLTSLQKFHIWMHADRNFNGRPLLGITLQLTLVAVIIALYYLVQSHLV